MVRWSVLREAWRVRGDRTGVRSERDQLRVLPRHPGDVHKLFDHYLLNGGSHTCQVRVPSRAMGVATPREARVRHMSSAGWSCAGSRCVGSWAVGASGWLCPRQARAAVVTRPRRTLPVAFWPRL